MVDVLAACSRYARLAATGEWPAELAIDPGAPDAGERVADLVLWFLQNRYPLMAVQRVAPQWLRATPAFQAALAEESAWYRTQHDEYAQVVDAWRREGITCLMIKSAGNYPSFPYTSDNIDVLVRPAQGVAARDTLRRMGYVELRNIEEPAKYLFRKFHDGRSISAIHVHEQVIWLVGFMDEPALWSRMQPSEDDPRINVPSPEDAILINLAHACYENKRFRFNDLIRVRHALSTRPLDWFYMERVAASRGWLDGLAFTVLLYAALEPALFGSALVPEAQVRWFRKVLRSSPYAWRELDRLTSQPNVDLPLYLSFAFCKWLYYRKIMADPTQPYRQRLVDTVSTLLQGVKLKSRVRPQRGIMVSVSGPDGTGKTAHATALARALQLCEVNATYFWARGGTTGLLELANRVRRALSPKATAGTPAAPAAAAEPDASLEDTVSRRRSRLRNPLVRFAWAWLVALDQVLTYGIRARLPMLLGHVVVSDRYVYDTAVELSSVLPPDARWSRRAIDAMLAAVPAPRFGYVLDVEGPTARQRKRDEPWHVNWDAQRREYARLAERYRLRLLSTEGSFARSNDVLIREVMMAYMGEFETPLNALFMANPSQRNLPDPAWGGPQREPAPSLGGAAA